MAKTAKPPTEGLYDFAVFIGRFQPPHNGHIHVIRQALKIARHVIVCVGSARAARSLRNPFTFEERADMISECFPEITRGPAGVRVHITPLLDYLYNDQSWIEAVQMTVQGIVCQYAIGTPRIALVGFSKDATGYYLKMFPQWKSIAVSPLTYGHGNPLPISSTPMRQEYFCRKAEDMEAVTNFLSSVESVVPRPVLQFMEAFAQSSHSDRICTDAMFARQYKEQWKSAPYPPFFVTVDAVVFQAGHVLMITRGDNPGKGMMALPGGFVKQDEKLRDAMVRELKEETGLVIPAPVLERAVGPVVFDDPHRSIRGRTVTHAYGLHLKEHRDGLPKVKGGDDAKKAFWVPLSELDPGKIYEDHYHIIRTMMTKSA